ncbi:MAG: SAM-dependent methyltransferase [Nannocystaceae bacterium]
MRRAAAAWDALTRAWAKLEEALAWSRLPLREGDVVVEIGAAPGGAALALLQRGAEVAIGIDPARMDLRAFHGARLLPGSPGHPRRAGAH